MGQLTIIWVWLWAYYRMIESRGPERLDPTNCQLQLSIKEKGVIEYDKGNNSS